MTIKDLDDMALKNTYNNLIGEVLNEVAKTYKEEVDFMDVYLSIENEDDQVLLSHIYMQMRNFFPVEMHECLMDYIIEEFADKNKIVEYKNILQSFIAIMS